MDFSTWVMVVVIAWTVLGLLLVALMWTRAPWKAILAWLGIALVPLGVWLVGLSQAAIDGWNTLALWWQSLVFSLPVMIGLSVLGLAAALLVISRLVPTRPRAREPKPPTSIPPRTTPPASTGEYRQPSGSSTNPTGSSAYPKSNPAEQTLILPEDRNNP